MSDHVYHVTEVVGTSVNSIDDAIGNAIGRSAQTLRNLDWFETTQIRGHLDDLRDVVDVIAHLAPSGSGSSRTVHEPRGAGKPW